MQLKAALQKKAEKQQLDATRAARKAQLIAALRGKLGQQELEDRLEVLATTAAPAPGALQQQQQQQQAYRQQQENIAPRDAEEQQHFHVAQQQGVLDSSTATVAQGLLCQQDQQQQLGVHPLEDPYHPSHHNQHESAVLTPDSNGHGLAVAAAAAEAAPAAWRPSEDGHHETGHPAAGGDQLVTEDSTASSVHHDELAAAAEYVPWQQYEGLQRKYRDAKERFFQMKELHGKDKATIKELKQQLTASKQQVGWVDAAEYNASQETVFCRIHTLLLLMYCMLVLSC